MGHIVSKYCFENTVCKNFMIFLCPIKRLPSSALIIPQNLPEHKHYDD